MKLYGKEYSKEGLLKKIGAIEQIGDLKLYEMIDGLGRGLRVVNAKNGCGINMNVLVDRGMDISELSYNSIPINWKSVVRESSPIYYESKGLEWLRTFNGGLLVTCGLTYAGVPCDDNGEELGLHGRIANLPAENIILDKNWDADNFIMTIQGTVREVKVFGDKLILKRKITLFMDCPKVIIEDIVENIGHLPSPLMIVYHINIGFPILDAGSLLLESEANVVPRDEEASRGFKHFHEFFEPVPDYNEQVFFHNIKADKEGNSNIGIVNEKFDNGNGLGIWLKFNKNNLPNLIQWKSLRCGEYACGIEPSNCLTFGRKEIRERKELVYLNPGEKKDFRLEFNVLRYRDEINDFKKIL
jgi:hypothetical protein